MFQDASLEPVSFQSCWKKKKALVDNHAQTSEILTNESATGPAEREDKGVQTEKEEEKPYKLVVDNSIELRDFLLKVEPMVVSALKMNNESHAFDGYEVCWEEETSSVSCLHTFTDPSYKKFGCTGVSWNSTGSVIVVSYGKYDHKDWCSHKSAICTWNLDRRHLDPKRPDISMEISNCVMCLSCHPELPAVIAIGTFSGEVRLVNYGSESDPLVASSGMSEVGHKEPVAKVVWVPASDQRRFRYNTLSLGSDGKILIWQQAREVGNQQLLLIQRYQLFSSSISRSIGVSDVETAPSVGGTSLSLTAEDKSVGVIGMENGSVVKCILTADELIDPVMSQNLAESVVKSPVQFSFKPQHGPVYSVSCSPFHRNLFLSCGTDTTARLYSMLDFSPLLVFEPDCGYLFSVAWSPTRPMVFAMGTSQGQLLLYDIKYSYIKSRLSLEVSSKKRPVYCLEYNSHRPQLLAAGDGSGQVTVWRLSSDLTVQKLGEESELDVIAQGINTV